MKETDFLSTGESFFAGLSLFDSLIEKVDSGVITGANIEQRLAYSSLNQLQRDLIESVVRQSDEFRFNKESYLNFCDLLDKVYRNTLIDGELEEELRQRNLTSDQGGEIKAVSARIKNLNKERDKIGRISRFTQQIFKGQINPKNLSTKLAYSGLSKSERLDLKEITYLFRDIRAEKVDLQNYQDILDRIFINEITPLNIKNEIKKAKLPVKKQKELEAIFKTVNKITDQFRRILKGCSSGDFEELFEYVNGFTIRDRRDIATQSFLKEVATQLQFQYQITKLTLMIFEAIEQGKIDKALDIVTMIPTQTNIGIETSGRLMNLSIRVRRIQDRGRILNLLAMDEIPFIRVFSELNALTLEDEDDQKIFFELRNLAVNLEKKVSREKILKMLAPFEASIESALSTIELLPLRSGDDINFRKELSDITKGVKRKRMQITIRDLFGKADAESVLFEITGLPEETDEDLEFKQKIFQSYREFIKVRKNINSKDFEIVFATEIEELLEDLKKRNKFAMEQPKGLNREAFKYLKSKYRATLFPLVESYRDDPQILMEMERVVPRNKFANSPALEFRVRIRDLEKQRSLSEIEKAYYRSIESLTVFSPYVIAAALADFGTTSVFLQNHFEILSKKTIANLKDGDYFPLIQVGTGPNGIISLGEIVRKNPGLAYQMLVIDSGKQPGGPFAIPNGPAWELNSANQAGRKALPDLPLENEEKTVRAYGSSQRWYPGERFALNPDIRPGSINKLVDWLADPDDLSSKRYPTNEELQVMLSLHASLCINNLALQTRLIREEPAPADDGLPGNKIATVAILGVESKEKFIRLRTDGSINALGLGDKSFGFDIKGKRAEKVINESKIGRGLPKASSTLDGFNGLADRTRQRPTEGLGEVIAIYGIGNSTDTIVEYLGRLFDSGNTDIKKVQKIYIIATSAPTRRPRYRKIDDLRPRLGRGNLISLISSRVGDFDFKDLKLPSEQRKLILYDDKDQVIKDEEGKTVEADNIIAATGFRPALDSIFAAYLPVGVSFKERLTPFTLPTDPEVSVGEILKDDQSILFVGTASAPRFNSQKLSQLPKGARDALIRVGAENAVAIGFRGPDTQAAVNIFLSKREFLLKPQSGQEELTRLNLTKNPGNENKVLSFPASVSLDNLKIQDNADPNRLLSSLLCYLLRPVLASSEEGKFNGEFQYRFKFNRQSGNFELTNGSGDFDNFVLEKLKNDYFQRYALSLLNTVRGRNPALSINIGFKNGRIDVANTYVN